MTTKVLHIARAPGGVGTHILTILSHSPREDVEHVVLASSEDEAFARAAKHLGAAIYQTLIRRRIDPIADSVALSQLLRIVRAVRPTIIRGHSSKAGAPGRLAGALTRVPVVFTRNAFGFLPFDGLGRRMALSAEQLLRPLTTVLVACSRSEAHRAIHELGFWPDKAVTMPNSLSFPSDVPMSPRSSVLHSAESF